MPRQAGDDHSGAPGFDDFIELLEHRGHTDEVDVQDCFDVCLLG
jgi:hypothetical protein